MCRDLSGLLPETPVRAGYFINGVGGGMFRAEIGKPDAAGIFPVEFFPRGNVGVPVRRVVCRPSGLDVFF